jgi:hypothetical protein
LEKLPEGEADVRCFQETRGYLVEQRRKKIVVVLIDDGYAEVGIVVELLGQVDAGKTAADHYNMLAIFFHISRNEVHNLLRKPLQAK